MHATARAAFGADVDDVVGHLNQVEVVLDDEDGVAFVGQLLEHVGQVINILEVQAGGGLVEDVEGFARVLLAELSGELYALCFAARERGGLLAQGEVAQAHVVEGLDFAQDAGLELEELHGLLHRHVEHVGNGFALEAHFERFAVVAAALAGFAGHVHVGQEVHLNGANAGTLAGFAAPALHVEGEATGAVAADFGLRHLAKQLADFGEHAGVSGRVRARRAPDGRLVHLNHLVHQIQPFDAAVGQRLTSWR